MSDVRKLIDNEVRLRLAMRAARVGLWDYRPGDEQVGANDEVARMLGYDPEEFVETRTAFVARLHEADRERVRRSFRDYLDSRTADYMVEFRMQMRDGSYRWFRSIGEIVERTTTGEPLRVVGVYLDIDDHVRAMKRLSELSSRLIRVQEAERARLARELHDELGQQLTAMKLSVHALARCQGQAAFEQHGDDCLSLVDDMLCRVRDHAFDLRPALLDDLGLGPALESWCARQEQRSDVCIVLDGVGCFPRLDEEVETTVFRVVQEAVTNALRHAGCDMITVTLKLDANHVSATIGDNGSGFDRERLTEGTGFGLSSIQERARLAGGELVLDSSSGGGTSVVLTVPIKS